ncbi:MAG TPA: hypothetical protein VD768_04600 [Sphingomicrobium sp.]|nr:hypothetical protein [Sphingomicrobium sp.]
MSPNPPREGYSRTMSVILALVAVIAAITFAVLIYWSTRGEPVQGPAAPQGEATIPLRDE